MIVRQLLEEHEKQTLSPYASLSCASRGRAVFEEECELRTIYQRDRDRILHCKAFRRMNDKTQVFLAVRGDHYRTRLTHTLEVSQIARTIAKALSLNEDLTEAIALGHDLGHTPFGHSGERALARFCTRAFSHSEQSLRVVDILEKNGRGLNLSMEVRDGIRNHQTKGSPHTLEGKVVRLSDKIAYIHHDMDDAMRAGLITEDDIPITMHMYLGDTNVDRLDTMVKDVISTSMGQNDVRMSDTVAEQTMLLRRLMFDDVYDTDIVRGEENKAVRMIGEMMEFYCEHPEHMSAECRHFLDLGEEVEQVACDYISGMTDQYCIAKYKELFVLKGWQAD